MNWDNLADTDELSCGEVIGEFTVSRINGERIQGYRLKTKKPDGSKTENSGDETEIFSNLVVENLP